MKHENLLCLRRQTEFFGSHHAALNGAVTQKNVKFGESCLQVDQDER
jgi:hypothetical protein